MAGETTSVSASTAFNIPKPMAAGLVSIPFTLSFSTTQNELNDVMEAGYLPPNMTVIGVIVSATDMDTNGSPALVYKVTVGSTDIVTGLTNGQTGASTVSACTPLALTAKTLVKVTSTTAAATAAAGTMYLNLLCVNN